MKPLIIAAPLPRTLELIFTPDKLSELHQHYEVVETTDEELADLPDTTLTSARYILGQPPLSNATLAKMQNLRAVLNVESNLIDNMPYLQVFERGIHVLTTGAVFAVPVAELGLGLALDLARSITEADVAFREGREQWGGDGNAQARLLSGADIGIIGFGDLGRALRKVLTGFNPRLLIHDPWLPDAILHEAGLQPASLSALISNSDFIFVTAAVTSENQHFIGAPEFSAMRNGASFILLSRAEVVDFDALLQAVGSGSIKAASDVFPQEPLSPDHAVRTLPGFIRSAHRAGALDVAFKQMGDMVLDDMKLMDRNLPPMRCKRAERETVNRMRSKPVTTN